MMKYRDFLDLASEMHRALGKGVSRLDEARGRTAVSRAYYSVFLRSQGVVGRAPGREMSSHKWVAEQLADSDNAKRSELGTALLRLKSLRVQADYEVKRPLSPMQIGLAVASAADYHRLLDGMNATES